MTEYIVKCNEFTTAIGNKLQFPDYIDYNQEVVRCRDCKYGVGEGLWCKHFANYGDLPTVQPDGFCAWGERRKNGDS